MVVEVEVEASVPVMVAVVAVVVAAVPRDGGGVVRGGSDVAGAGLGVGCG
ncbi:hypothetical protein [Streptomyces sp. NPDC059788]